MNTTPPAGYSGTPLFKKLGYKAGIRVYLSGAPDNFRALLEPLPPGVIFETGPSQATDLAHIFVSERGHLASELSALRRKLKPEASLWVSWPKKSSRLPSTVTEDIIRELALPLGFVDVKVCAVTEIWSGLKLMVRKELR